jgi:6-pyruvoyltetrahydropterin/6-carboxytetrahydropterin synthase
MVLSKKFRFESAHFLPGVPPGHPCGRLHGHSYRLEVAIRGTPDPGSGWVRDFGEVSQAVRPVIAPLDHNLLNSVAGLENPTSENLCIWLWERLAPLLPDLHRITLRETCQSCCVYRGPGGLPDRAR